MKNMKRRIFLAMLLCIAGVLGLRAQTDVTSTYLTNPSFESDGGISTSNGALSITGWTQSDPGAQYNNTGCYNASATLPTQGTVTVTPSAGNYFLFFRKGWSPGNAYKFTSEEMILPAGAYTISVDYKMVEGYDNTQNNTTAVEISAYSGETKLGTTGRGTTKTNVSGGNAYTYLNTADWSKAEGYFSLEDETQVNIIITLSVGGQRRSDFVVDNVRLYHMAITRPTAISLDKNSLSLGVGESATLTPTITPSEANTDTAITWSSSDASVAAVSNGVVTGTGSGTATITATTANGKTATCTVTVSMINPPAYYSEIAAGDFYIVNAATGLFLGGAHDWGTQASLIEHGIPFTVAVGDGVYTLDSHTYNNANDHFLTGTYVDGGSTNLYITSLGSGKYSISTGNGSAYLVGEATTLIVSNSAADANNPLAQWYFLSKADRDALFADATDANPADATYYLTEANISRNLRKAYNTSGWSGSFSYGGTNVNQCAERYCNNTNVYQELTVPNGKYTVKCQGFYRRQSAENISYLYANDVLQELNRIEFGGINSMAGASDAFSNGEYWNELTVYVTDGELKVGIKCDANTNWTIWDNFEIYYNGPIIGGEAEALPAGNMTADKWYYFDVAVDGDYILTTTTLNDIVYTTDATILIENESSVTTHFANTTPIALTAGRYYVKSSSAQTLEVAAYSFSYNVGNAVFSVADGGYTQESVFTVTFPNAATSDPNGVAALVSGAKAMVNGVEVALTAVTNGFSLDLGTLVAATAYAISIPAGVYGYAGESLNEAISLTVNTPVVLDGIFYLRTADGKYASRGGNYNTRAMVDEFGLPMHVSTNPDGTSEFLFVDNRFHLFDAGSGTVYTDNNSNPYWRIQATSGGYNIINANDNGSKDYYLGIEDDHLQSVQSAYVWTLEPASQHAANVAPLKDAQAAATATAAGITASTKSELEALLASDFKSKVIDITGVNGIQEEYQIGAGSDYAGAGHTTYTETVNDLEPGIYKLQVNGFFRMTWYEDVEEASGVASNVYVFLGDDKTQMASPFDAYADAARVSGNDYQGVNGKFYPNGQTAAGQAYDEGQYVNEVYVFLPEGTSSLTFGIFNPNRYGNDGDRGAWLSYRGFTLTRYYNSEVGGDEEQEILDELRYTVGDLTGDNKISLSDVTTLVNIVGGTTTEYNERSANIDGNGDVDEADVRVLAQWLANGREPEVVDETWRYANVEAIVYAEQTASENANGASYTINSAICPLTNEDVSDKVDMKEFLTTLNISVSLSDVKSVSVYAKGQENIAGVMTYNTYKKTATYSAGDSPSVYASADQANKNMYSDVVTVTGDNAGTYVAYLLPVELSNGVTVTVRDSNGKFYSQDFTVTAGQENNLTFTETTATNNWMATIPGNINFSMLSTPGSHNSATSNCSSAAKCQSETIAQQLANGVRAFDIRPTYKYSSTITTENLYIFHGMVNTNVLYKDAIAAMVEFLQAHPTEAISVIMVKEDGTPLLGSWTDYTTEMCNAIDAIHTQYTDYIKLLDHSYYTLDDYRGKIFFGYRNAWDLHKTVRVTNWPDAASVTDYSVGVGGTCSASVEDAYNTSGDSKKTVVNALLNLASANENRARFHYTFTSVANSITSSANTQNPAAATYISGTLTGPTGYVYADFMGSSSYSGQTLLKAVIEQNYKYVYKGRTRVQ